MDVHLESLEVLDGKKNISNVIIPIGIIKIERVKKSIIQNANYIQIL